ncbi:hypothetical protein CAOG_02665 [Capsaspora owczarzaki ATCC 30864]|uniref:FYVE-type domain-containing protein n=1 Tax=Capsaspora owczarzaki (strain ATCC 30864) TaxID=595528 RepID=A0A0D2VMW2_CAPO3|nr:hypothetical protein CAOG_02665 [Capsaspora owczarzaki ATCC 30864]KJE91537.1 hypothetical protein CAOG_002665 [Capsaspora owczarzaki ATCC 30864]|eukprot:XP_004349415.1 hypothetical protein CAOG_02665 [Capsaspora owczarzaki ATCC 30864]
MTATTNYAQLDARDSLTHFDDTHGGLGARNNGHDSDDDDVPGGGSAAATGKVLVYGRGGQRWMNPDERPTPFQLEEPGWRADTTCNACMACNEGFSFFVRRHHCRRCGDLFCSSCCENELQVMRLGYQDPVRVCKACKPKVERENEFFRLYLKVIQKGDVFDLHRGNSAIPVLLQLSSTERDLVITQLKTDPDTRKRSIDTSSSAIVESLPIEALVEVRQVRRQPNAAGDRADTFVLKFSSGGEFEFSCEDKKQRAVWTTSLRRALEVLLAREFAATPIKAMAAEDAL